MITVSIVCFNEAKKVESCLLSVKDFADEITIVDLGSKDNIEVIARKFHAKLYYHPEVEYVESVRNFALSKASGDWVLVLDPDETLSDIIKTKLKEIIREDKVVAVNIPRKNIFFGKWISHTNWWPDKQIRFFKKESIEYSDEIHSYPKINGKILELPSREEFSIIHFGYTNIAEFVSRQNRYSKIEAKQRFEKGERFSWMSFFWWPSREFMIRYIRYLGFLDGLYGFFLTFLMMVYKIIVLVKIWEIENN